jgi:arylsulfatase A-like enzyme
MTTAMDESIGKIIEALKQKGIFEKTLIVYSSDNGGTSWGRAGSNDPLRGGKADIYEGGVRVCAFASWPGRIPAGIKIDEPVHIIDWYPTLIGLAGGSLEQELPIDGKDIWPLLSKGAESPHREILIIGSVSGQRGIRKGSSGRVELYDLANDIAEKNNLAEKFPERVAAMIQQLESHLKSPANPDDFYSPKEAKANKAK